MGIAVAVKLDRKQIIAYLACISCGRWWGLAARQLSQVRCVWYFTCPFCHHGRTRASATVRSFPDRAAPAPERLDTHPVQRRRVRVLTMPRGIKRGAEMGEACPMAIRWMRHYWRIQRDIHDTRRLIQETEALLVGRRGFPDPPVLGLTLASLKKRLELLEAEAREMTR